MPKKVILYHDDADGRCCAAIAALHWRKRHGSEGDVVYVPCEYGAALDWGIFDGLVCDDEVWLLDFSYAADVMEKIAALCQPRRFIWIDHHVTAIERLAEFAMLPGIRKPTEAACLLTWIYCGLGPEIPDAVRYIADRDMWKFFYGDKTRRFYEIMRLKDTRPWAECWGEWLSSVGIDRQLAYGEILYTAKMRSLESMARRLGWEEPIHGSAGKMLVINYPGCGELGEIGRARGFEVVHCWHEEIKDGRRVRVHNLYAGGPEVDVGAMAKLRGGGGHKGAAGWVEELK